MAKFKKKIDKSHYHRFKERIETEKSDLEKEFDLIARRNGWANGEARMFAFMQNYISYNKGEKLEFEGD